MNSKEAEGGSSDSSIVGRPTCRKTLPLGDSPMGVEDRRAVSPDWRQVDTHHLPRLGRARFVAARHFLETTVLARSYEKPRMEFAVRNA